ncbi:MAG: type II toxin-antitoxin system RelE/ParE family toxin [Pseudomonadota bacterium]
MVFVETPIFTRHVQDLLPDDHYRDLQDELRKRPDAGSKIRGSGGLRKLRWAIKGQGRSGGVRVIYYRITARDQIFMLYIYPKSKQADLSPEQLKVLKRAVEEELS